MKIVIATPLYPPDIESTALYVKELSRRLSEKHEVTVVLYGDLPEQVPGVKLVSVSKRKMLLVRIFSFLFALISASKNADIIYTENGSSVELPVLILRLLFRKKIVTHIGDMKAHEWTQKTRGRKYLEKMVLKESLFVIESSPLPRPEILPFDPYPKKLFEEYEQSWQKHLLSLEKIFHALSS